MELADGAIRLRRPRQDDAPWIVAACRDPLNQRWLPMLPSPYGEADAAWWLERAATVWDAGTAAPFVIEDRATGAPLGVIEVRLEFDPPDVGYWLAPEGRGRGAMTRALRLLVQYAFDELDVAALELYTLFDNVASQRVAERAGFTRSGVARGRVPSRDGATYDAYVFRLARPS